MSKLAMKQLFWGLLFLGSLCVAAIGVHRPTPALVVIGGGCAFFSWACYMAGPSHG